MSEHTSKRMQIMEEEAEIEEDLDVRSLAV